jgi:hypothetical protein
VANLSNILATCARVIVWYGINDSVVLYDVIQLSYIQLIDSINSELSVNVSFHAIMAKLTLLQVVEVSPVQETISLESGLEVSGFGLLSDVLVSSHLDFSSSICFR